jgi:Helix-turn-helix domain
VNFSLPEADSIEAAQIPAVLTGLAALQAALAARLMVASPVPEPQNTRADDDDLLDTEQAAAYLHCSSKWLYRHARQLSAKRRGREFLWSRRALDRWLSRQTA